MSKSTKTYSKKIQKYRIYTKIYKHIEKYRKIYGLSSGCASASRFEYESLAHFAVIYVCLRILEAKCVRESYSNQEAAAQP